MCIKVRNEAAPMHDSKQRSNSKMPMNLEILSQKIFGFADYKNPEIARLTLSHRSAFANPSTRPTISEFSIIHICKRQFENNQSLVL